MIGKKVTHPDAESQPDLKERFQAEIVRELLSGETDPR